MHRLMATGLGRWAMGDGRWAMGDGRWAMGDGRWAMGDGRWGESIDKPGSVKDCHSSGHAVTSGLKQPTREHRGPRHGSPIWPCSGWGLPCRRVLPPTRCALTAPFHPDHARLAAPFGGLFSVALSVGSRRPGVTWHPALWSPDFPPRIAAPRQSDQLRRTF